MCGSSCAASRLPCQDSNGLVSDDRYYLIAKVGTGFFFLVFFLEVQDMK